MSFKRKLSDDENEGEIVNKKLHSENDFSSNAQNIGTPVGHGTCSVSVKKLEMNGDQIWNNKQALQPDSHNDVGKNEADEGTLMLVDSVDKEGDENPSSEELHKSNELAVSNTKGRESSSNEDSNKENNIEHTINGQRLKKPENAKDEESAGDDSKIKSKKFTKTKSAVGNKSSSESEDEKSTNSTEGKETLYSKKSSDADSGGGNSERKKESDVDTSKDHFTVSGNEQLDDKLNVKSKSVSGNGQPSESGDEKVMDSKTGNKESALEISPDSDAGEKNSENEEEAKLKMEKKKISEVSSKSDNSDSDDEPLSALSTKSKGVKKTSSACKVTSADNQKALKKKAIKSSETDEAVNNEKGGVSQIKKIKKTDNKVIPSSKISCGEEERVNKSSLKTGMKKNSSKTVKNIFESPSDSDSEAESTCKKGKDAEGKAGKCVMKGKGKKNSSISPEESSDGEEKVLVKNEHKKSQKAKNDSTSDNSSSSDEEKPLVKSSKSKKSESESPSGTEPEDSDAERMKKQKPAVKKTTSNSKKGKSDSSSDTEPEDSDAERKRKQKPAVKKTTSNSKKKKSDSSDTESEDSDDQKKKKQKPAVKKTTSNSKQNKRDSSDTESEDSDAERKKKQKPAVKKITSNSKKEKSDSSDPESEDSDDQKKKKQKPAVKKTTSNSKKGKSDSSSDTETEESPAEEERPKMSPPKSKRKMGSSSESKRGNKKSKREKDSVPSKEEMLQLKKYTTFLRIAGIRYARYADLWEGCTTTKAKIQRIKDRLREAGVKGVISKTSCMKFKKKKDREEEVQALDINNIVDADESTGRPSRRKRPPQPTEEIKKAFSRIKVLADSDSD